MLAECSDPVYNKTQKLCRRHYREQLGPPVVEWGGRRATGPQAALREIGELLRPTPEAPKGCPRNNECTVLCFDARGSAEQLVFGSLTEAMEGHAGCNKLHTIVVFTKDGPRSFTPAPGGRELSADLAVALQTLYGRKAEDDLAPKLGRRKLPNNPFRETAPERPVPPAKPEPPGFKGGGQLASELTLGRWFGHQPPRTHKPPAEVERIAQVLPKRREPAALTGCGELSAKVRVQVRSRRKLSRRQRKRAKANGRPRCM